MSRLARELAFFCPSGAVTSVGLAEQLESENIDVLACRPGQTDSEMLDMGRAVIDPKAFVMVMPAAACVDETMAALGKSIIVNPGPIAKIFTVLTNLMPRWMTKLVLDRNVLSMVTDRSFFQRRPFGARS